MKTKKNPEAAATLPGGLKEHRAHSMRTRALYHGPRRLSNHSGGI